MMTIRLEVWKGNEFVEEISQTIAGQTTSVSTDFAKAVYSGSAK